MKYSLLVLLITTLSMSVLGQNYIPFEMSVGTYWRNSSYNCCFNGTAPSCTAEHYSEVISDTIMGNKKYCKIKKGYLSNNGSANCLSANYSVIHYLREDTLMRKVYEGSGTGQEALIMDFSQQVGDTCNLYFYNAAQYYIVTVIDSVLINNVYHKRINYGGGAFSLIEGVGCTLGITELWYDFENSTTLTCKGNNGVTQYPDTILNPNSCVPVHNLGINTIQPEQLRLDIFPNPSQSIVTCSLHQKKIVLVKLYNLVGIVLFEKKYNSTKVVMDISSFPKGVYGLAIFDEQGNGYYKKLQKD